MTDPDGVIDFGAIAMEVFREHFQDEMRARLDANAKFAVTTVAEEAERFGRNLVQVERGISGDELVDRIASHLRALADRL
jgi:hypothetical protein